MYNDELYHFSLPWNKEKRDHNNVKYIAKVPMGKKQFRYFYTQKEYDAYLKSKGSLLDRAKNYVKSIPDNVSKTFKEQKERIIGTGKYDSTSKNYDQIKNDIVNSKEWKKIVMNRDPEYRRRDASGNVYYDYDKYLFNKKHPVLDALWDVNDGRKISILDQNIDTFLAGSKDYIRSGINALENLASIGVGTLTTMLQLNQGTKFQNTEVMNQLKDTPEGRKLDEYVDMTKDTLDTANELYKRGKETYETIQNERDKVKSTQKIDPETKKAMIKTATHLAMGTITPEDVKFIGKIGVKAVSQYTGMTEEEMKDKLLSVAVEAAKDQMSAPDIKNAAKQIIGMYGDANDAAPAIKNIKNGKGSTEDAKQIYDSSIKAYAKANNMSEAEAKSKMNGIAKNTANGKTSAYTMKMIKSFAKANGISEQAAEELLVGSLEDAFLANVNRR